MNNLASPCSSPRRRPPSQYRCYHPHSVRWCPRYVPHPVCPHKDEKNDCRSMSSPDWAAIEVVGHMPSDAQHKSIPWHLPQTRRTQHQGNYPLDPAALGNVGAHVAGSASNVSASSSAAVAAASPSSMCLSPSLSASSSSLSSPLAVT